MSEIGPNSPVSAHPKQEQGCAPTVTGIALLLWLAVIPAVVMVLGSLLLDDLAPAFQKAIVITVAAALLLPVMIAALLLTRKRLGWEGVHALAVVLAAFSGYLLLDAVMRAILPAHPNWLAALRLGLLLPYVFIVWRLMGAPTHEEARGATLPTVLLATAVAALLTLPWALTGALGDSLVSLGLLFQALAENLPLALLLWGASYPFLKPRFTDSRVAALTVILLFALAVAGGVFPTGDWGALANALLLLPLGFLATELVVRGHSSLAALPVLLAVRLASRLFIDPRDIEAQGIPEVQHMISLAITWLATLIVGLLLWGVRKFRDKAPYSSRGALAFNGIAALVLLSLWLGVYFLWGTPGFFNDSFLIVLEEQADLSAAYSIADRQERLSYVYGALVGTAERSQAPIRAELDRRGLVYRPYYLINMIRVEGHTLQMRRFEKLPGVAQVIRNPNVRMYAHRIALPSYGTDERPVPELQDNLDAINADGAWELGVTGTGIVVAGQDTGYEWAHPALMRQYRGWDGAVADHTYNWHDAWSEFEVPTDEDGHGTHTMGTVLGHDGDDNRTGVAPDAQWIGCRNMRRGVGNPASYTECMEFFLAPYPQGGDPFLEGDVRYAPHLTTNSWGCPEVEGCQPDTLKVAVEALRAAGIMTVVAAGNDGPGCSTTATPPSNYDAAFTVGAVYSYGDNSITGFSSRGPAYGLLKPDIVAPGYDVRSSFPDASYAYAPGTSMATPHVAGLVALIWSANSTLIGDIDATENLVRETATPKSLSYICTPEEASQEDPLGLSETGPLCACGDVTGTPNNVYGYGLINAEAAVKAALGK